jgi:cytochrome P450
MTQDTVVSGVTIKKGSLYSILFDAIHHDPEQWIEHMKYEPDRFDTTKTDNRWLLAANGKPRNPLSFTPFMGGKRVCLGKTFAEVTTRFTVPLLFHFCDFEFIDPA